jgi:hypothetical protein
VRLLKPLCVGGGERGNHFGGARGTRVR